MFGHAVEIFDTESFPETQDPVGKNDIHGSTYLRTGIRKTLTVALGGDRGIAEGIAEKRPMQRATRQRCMS